MKTLLLFGVVLIYICVSIVLTGMSYRRQGTLSLAARDSLRKIIITEPELSTLSPVNTSLRDFQQARTTLPSTFSKRENSRDRPMQNEKELDQPSLDDSKLPSSTQEDISSAEDVSDQSDSNSTTTTFLFQESYGILVDAVPSAILVSLSPDISPFPGTNGFASLLSSPPGSPPTNPSSPRCSSTTSPRTPFFTH